MMMYAPSTGSTTSGSGLPPSSSAPPSERRVRVVRLLRPRRAAPAFGFSLRGGREYATGFFISKVDFNSEAHLQGLKVGDQLVSVNGYRVDDAVHSELVHYLASQSRLKIKVRHVGMIPVKDKAHEALSWQFVSEHASLGSGVSSPTLCDTDRITDLRLSILVPPRAKLGCGICKGPDWKPGIYVQFVRDGGIAREAGLRPGDQILSCNGQDFANITFNEAISAMKVSGRLELVVREGAGLELVSPESSGYNSSASSAAGERSPAPTAPAPPAPPAALRRRLASVAEEAADRADRLTMNRLKRRTWDSLDFNWKSDIHNFDAPSDIEPDYDCPSIPNNPHTYENKTNLISKNKEYISSPSNRTIINLTEDGATIQCSYDNQNARKTFLSNPTNRVNDKKTIVVEVHHTSNNNCGKQHCNFPAPLKTEVTKKISMDASSISSSATLSSAIAEEIQRRKLNKKNSNNEENVANVNKNPNIPKAVENEKKKQHDALMDEFKKVHRKMFANQENKDEVARNVSNSDDIDSLDRQQTLPLRSLDKADLNSAAGGNLHSKKESTACPPPPPPMPTTNGHQTSIKHEEESKVTSKINEINQITNIQKNGTILRTPTPDYNGYKKEPAPIVPIKIKNGKDEKAELESLESFKLKNPLNVQHNPPPNYFMRAPNGTATMKKHARPVSVTIGEYAGGGGVRREPSKLDFLSGDKPDGPHAPGGVPITNRLQSELVLTLSRSNLRKKTDIVGNAVVNTHYFEDSDSVLDKVFHSRYGNNLLPLPPSITIPKASKLKP